MGHLNPVGYLVHKMYNPSLDLVARILFLTNPRGHSSNHPVATIQWPTTWFEHQMGMPLASWYIRPKDTVTPKRTWMLFPQSLPYFWDFSEKTKNVLFLGTYTFLFNCKESSISKQSQGGRSRLSIEWLTGKPLSGWSSQIPVQHQRWDQCFWTETRSVLFRMRMEQNPSSLELILAHIHLRVLTWKTQR